MKYMVISHFKDSFWMLTRENQTEKISLAASVYEKFFKSGKLLEFYYLCDMKGAVTIWDLASPEEFVRICLDNPLTTFMDDKFVPLIERDAVNNILKEKCAGAKKKGAK
ncbi:MAG: hypothetical protein ABR924_19950 [Terracidiphilus sp.]